MSNGFPPVIDATDFTFDVPPPEFLELAVGTLGDAGTDADGYEEIFHTVTHDVGTLPGTIAAIKECFGKVEEPWANFQEPWEAPAGEAFAGAIESGNAALGAFEDTFASATPPTIPTPTPGPSGGGGSGPSPGGQPPGAQGFDGCPPHFCVDLTTGKCVPERECE